MQLLGWCSGPDKACEHHFRIEPLFVYLQVIGDEDLAAKFEESALTIRRDIIFAASLYI